LGVYFKLPFRTLKIFPLLEKSSQANASGKWMPVHFVRREVLAWAAQRNDDQTTVEWKFAQPDARKKLHRHYEKVQKFL